MHANKSSVFICVHPRSIKTLSGFQSAIALLVFLTKNTNLKVKFSIVGKQSKQTFPAPETSAYS